ncbi:MAG TPA: Uma2 family endonuclease [Bacillota bacterium]|nr:Uma2 family endonuclease [Bacillota bacterium]
MGLAPADIAARQAAAAKKTYTYEDYRKLPEGAPYQLIGGMLIMTPAPSTYHQIISMKLEVKLASFVMERDLGLVLYAPLDVYFEESETYQPDLIFIAGERLSIIEPDKINGAPDLVVEILSPGTAYYDLRKKYKIYEKHMVREYWVIDPEEQSVEIYALQDGKFTLGQRAEKQGTVSSTVIEGFTLSVESIF